MLPKVVIIGNGITGITVARYLRKYFSQIPIKIISKEYPYFFSRTALMYVYMGHMQYKDLEPYERWFWKKNHFDLIYNEVTYIDFTKKEIYFKDNSKEDYDILILATGSKPNKFGWPGQDLNRVQGLYSLQDLQNLEQYTKEGIKKAVIVGGGLIGIELAEMFHSKKIPVTFLVRETSFWNIVLPEEESQIVNQEILKHHIDLRLSTELKEITGDENNNANGVFTNKNEFIPCNFVGLTAGVSPNIDFLKNTFLETNRGILINRFFETNIKDVYAAGDCAEFKEVYGNERPIEQLWYTGKLQGMALAGILIQRIAKKYEYNIPKSIDRQFEERYLKKEQPYNRGIWFNSAKFFTIEYQTYGYVPNKPQNTFIWHNPKKNIFFRIVWEKLNNDTKITGLNLLNLRFRHEVCEQWIKEERSINYVIDHLKEAFFNPEFYYNPVKDIQKQFYHNQTKGVLT
ncbi:MAG: hypothetical protein KatS3mg129_2377 [Leptospiraceae bacterium]|nr:MAG: hypothetical protein KatS3mg129_2377 [Leptospiraceae bacterium]